MQSNGVREAQHNYWNPEGIQYVGRTNKLDTRELVTTPCAYLQKLPLYTIYRSMTVSFIHLKQRKT